MKIRLWETGNNWGLGMEKPTKIEKRDDKNKNSEKCRRKVNGNKHGRKFCTV